MLLALKTAVGQTFLFNKFSYDDNWKQDVGGLYIFVKYDPVTRKWVILYIGEARCIKTRVSNHNKWDKAVNLGASAVFTCLISSELVRCFWETKLIEYYQPVLNEKDNPRYTGSGLGGISRGLRR